MRWRVIVVKKPVTAHTRVIHKILFEISHTVVFGIPRLFSSSRTVNRRSPLIANRTRSILSNVLVVEGRPERESLSTEAYATGSSLPILPCDNNSLYWNHTIPYKRTKKPIN